MLLDDPIRSPKTLIAPKMPFLLDSQKKSPKVSIFFVYICGFILIRLIAFLRRFESSSGIVFNLISFRSTFFLNDTVWICEESNDRSVLCWKVILILYLLYARQ